MGQKGDTDSSRNSGTLTVRANISSKCCKTCPFSAGSWRVSDRYGVLIKASVGNCPSSMLSSVLVVSGSTSIFSGGGAGVCKRLSSLNAKSRMRLSIGWTSGTQRLIVLMAAPRVIFSRYVKVSTSAEKCRALEYHHVWSIRAGPSGLRASTLASMKQTLSEY